MTQKYKESRICHCSWLQSGRCHWSFLPYFNKKNSVKKFWRVNTLNCRVVKKASREFFFCKIWFWFMKICSFGSDSFVVAATTLISTHRDKSLESGEYGRHSMIFVEFFARKSFTMIGLWDGFSELVKQQRVPCSNNRLIWYEMNRETQKVQRLSLSTL